MSDTKHFFNVTDSDTEHQTPNDAERFINPFLLDLTVTKWTCIPSYLILTISSVQILCIVYKHYRAVLNVHFSVFFYIFCQLQLLLITTASWITESTGIETSLSNADFEQRCKMKVTFQTYSAVLPGYAVLMMTLVRTIFVVRPLSYFNYIRRRYQVSGAGLAVLLCGLIASLPSLDILCGTQLNSTLVETLVEEEEIRYCSYGGGSCQLYFALLIGIGCLLPNILISSLYIYIYKITVNARKVHDILTKTQIIKQRAAQNRASSSTETEDGNPENKMNDRVSKERRSIPWSIIAILIVFVVSSTPWIVLQVLKVEITEVVVKQELVLVFLM